MCQETLNVEKEIRIKYKPHGGHTHTHICKHKLKIYDRYMNKKEKGIQTKQ